MKTLWKSTGGYPPIVNDPNFVCECDDPDRRGCIFPGCKIAILREAKDKAREEQRMARRAFKGARVIANTPTTSGRLDSSQFGPGCKCNNLRGWGCGKEECKVPLLRRINKQLKKLERDASKDTESTDAR